ncbi:hypothetical protein [Lawsonibacter sp. JLR.KK007]|uniref:hypothetical protein n=1 Tax=Lawsonibacter sp. JLR.KK007 TaxID=3114293 RepID=UPI002FF07A57
MSAEKRDSVVGISRNLTDALMAQIDSGVIIPTEESALQWNSMLDYAPNRNDISDMREDVWIGIGEFQKLAERFKMPTHNAVAFFETAIEKEKELRASSAKRDAFRSLIHLALSGRGFVFGTAFDGERPLSVRPCDSLESFNIPAESSEKFRQIAWRNNALLSGAVYFQQDYACCQRIIDELKKQSEITSGWLGIDKAIKNDAVVLSEKNIRDFFEIYREYCIEQTGAGENRATCEIAEGQKVLQDLRYIEETIMLLISLDQLIHRLEAVLEIPADNLRLSEKIQWLDDFYEWLRNADQDKLNHVTGIELGVTPLLGLNDFIIAAKSGAPPKGLEKQLPILDRKVASKSLRRSERQALYEYQKHPFYQCFRGIQSELSKVWVAEVAPFYLMHWFINKLNPKGPFLKKSYKFTNVHIQIADSVKAPEDWRLFFFQHCHLHFFDKLCDWYETARSENPTLAPCNQKLCNALYARCRNQLVKQEWLVVGSEHMPPDSNDTGSELIPDISDSEIPIFMLYQQLDGMFDCFHIPVYAKSMCRTDNLFYFFYEKQDLRVVKIKRKIREILRREKHALVKRYKEIAFLNPDGIGHGIMPLEWHQRLAEYLESVIKSDSDVKKYAMGDIDPYYPGSRIRLSAINKGIRYEENRDKIFPEDVQPYLAIVEWYMQKACGDMIAADLQPRVLGMCKRLFLESG